MSIYEDYNFGYNTDIYDNVGSNIFASLAAYSAVASIISIGVSVIIIISLFKIFTPLEDVPIQSNPSSSS